MAREGRPTRKKPRIFTSPEMKQGDLLDLRDGLRENEIDNMLRALEECPGLEELTDDQKRERNTMIEDLDSERSRLWLRAFFAERLKSGVDHYYAPFSVAQVVTSLVDAENITIENLRTAERQKFLAYDFQSFFTSIIRSYIEECVKVGLVEPFTLEEACGKNAEDTWRPGQYILTETGERVFGDNEHEV